MFIKVFVVAIVSWYGQALFASTDVVSAVRAHLDKQITDGIPSSVVLKKDRSNISVMCGVNRPEKNCLHSLMVGVPQELCLTIHPTGDDRISTDRLVRLLVFDGENKIIPFALTQWRWSRDILHVANTNDDNGIFVNFRDVSLSQLLPIGAQLVVLHGNPHGEVFYYQTLPMTTVRHARQGLTVPISLAFIETLPPRVQWTLPLETKVGEGAVVRWYLQLISDDGYFRVEVDAGEFSTTRSSSLLSIASKIQPGHDRCYKMTVFIDPSEMWLQSTIVNGNYGNCQ